MLQENEKETKIKTRLKFKALITRWFLVYNLYSPPFPQRIWRVTSQKSLPKKIAKDNPALLAASAHEELLPVHLSSKWIERKGFIKIITPQERKHWGRLWKMICIYFPEENKWIRIL